MSKTQLADYFYVTNGCTTIGLFAMTEVEAIENFKKLTKSNLEAWIVSIIED